MIAGASAGGSAAGGTTTTEGGTTTTQGGNDSGGEPMCEGLPPSCVLSCRSFEGATLADCVGHQYVCPEPSIAFDTCPDDACSRRANDCCAPTGQRTVPDCAPDGTIGRCPEGYEVRAGACLPQGVDIQNCSELQSGDPCTNAELVCYTSKCGRNCSCMADESSKLTWHCSSLPC
jgi:hypothetical protein